MLTILVGAERQAAPCGNGPLVEGKVVTDTPSLAKPPKGILVDEPTFHTCMRRMTDHDKEGIPGFSRSDYSRRQSFNVDSSLFFTNSRDGGWFLYDTKSFKLLGSLKGLQGDAEPQWHASEPHTLYYGYRNGGMQIMALDVRTMKSRVVIDLHGKLPWPKAARAWTKSEGSPSADGRYWGFQVETEKFDILGFAIWDLQKDQLVSTLSTGSRPDHVSMSPSGRWFVASGDDAVDAYSLDFKTKQRLAKNSEHSDIAIGANGHDHYVSIDYGSNEGWVYMTDLETGTRTNLYPTYINGAASAMHFSGKAYAKPGWVLLSTYASGGPKQWYFDKVFAMELKPKPRIIQLAAHRSLVKDAYFAEPQATVNRDFTRVMFNTNWGVAKSTDIDAYEVLVPPNVLR
jgi:hypothetical protein